MSLIECPDCGRKISDRAPACPGCGAPNSAAARPAQPQPRPQTQTIEQTGKPFKIAQIIGVIMLALGILLLFGQGFDHGTPVAGVIVAVLGVGTVLMAKLMAWFEHG